MTAVEPAVPVPAAIRAQATDLPEPLRPDARRPRTDYWDAADACWHCGGGTGQLPSPRTRD